jgi:hypothetical protein
LPARSSWTFCMASPLPLPDLDNSSSSNAPPARARMPRGAQPQALTPKRANRASNRQESEQIFEFSILKCEKERSHAYERSHCQQ